MGIDNKLFMKGKLEFTTSEIHHFLENGYTRIADAFSTELAKECRDILWEETGCDPHDSSTWTKAVIRLGDHPQKPFVKAANTPALHSAFDQLVGKGNWVPRNSLGAFPIRFPANELPNDTGWHVDSGFPRESRDDFMKWRINFRSKGRGLLMLFLFSDVTVNDAPTRIREGSHFIVARLLKPYGESGLSFMELASKLRVTDSCKEVIATGKAGTVYLCHPFIVHAAQRHLGVNPKFMAQPPLHLKKDFELNSANKEISLVELAILKGIENESH
jgi:hypothetical protein